MNPRDLPGLSEEELVALGPCAVCGKGVFETGDLTFYTFETARYGAHMHAIRERQGLGMMLQSGPLARVFASHEHLAKQVDHPIRYIVHECCAATMVPHPLQVMQERNPTAEENDDA
ncbi:MAG: hypothetical protein R3C70_07175 [Geminicoccaceae bacterium]